MEKEESFDESQLVEALKDECTVIQGRRKRRSRFLTQSENVEENNQVMNENDGSHVITTSIRHHIRVVATQRSSNNISDNVESVATIDRIFETSVYQKYIENQRRAAFEKQKEKAGSRYSKYAGVDAKGKTNDKRETIVYQTEYIPDPDKRKKPKSKTKNSKKKKSKMKTKRRKSTKKESTRESTESTSEDTESETTSTSTSSNSRRQRIYDYAYAYWWQNQYGYYDTRYLNPGYNGQQYSYPGHHDPRRFFNPGYQGPHRFPNPVYHDPYRNSYPGYRDPLRFPNPVFHDTRFSYPYSMVSAPAYSYGHNSRLYPQKYQYPMFPRYEVDPISHERRTESRMSRSGYDTPRRKRSKKNNREPRTQSRDKYNTNESVNDRRPKEKIAKGKTSDNGNARSLSRNLPRKLTSSKAKTDKPKVSKSHSNETTVVGSKVTLCRDNNRIIDDNNNISDINNNKMPKENKPSKSKRFVEISEGWKEQFYEVEVAQVADIKSSSDVKIKRIKRKSIAEVKSASMQTELPAAETQLPKSSFSSTKKRMSTDKATQLPKPSFSGNQTGIRKPSFKIKPNKRKGLAKDISSGMITEISADTETQLPNPSFSSIQSGIQRPSFKIKKIKRKGFAKGKYSSMLTEISADTETEKPKPSLWSIKTWTSIDTQLSKPSFSSTQTGIQISTAGIESQLAPSQLENDSTTELQTSDDDSSDLNDDRGSIGSSERGDEWLAYTESETFTETFTEDIEPAIDRPIRDLEEECYALMKATNPLFTCMKAIGRMPLTMYIEDKCVKFSMDKRSRNFYAFCATTIVIAFMSILLLSGVITVIFLHPPLEFYEQIQKLEMDKYWCITALVLLNMLHIVAWSTAVIFSNGVNLAEFLTRWNLALIATKYSSVTKRVMWYITAEFIANLLYSVLIIILFIGDFVPAVRGSSGFIAMSILGPFFVQVRLHRHFLCFQIFGMFVHLYVIFSSRLIMVLVLVYCRILENYTKRWNLRLAYQLRKLAIGKLKERQIIQHKVIPYMKLFAEHLVATSFLRHTGAVFNVALLSFFILKAFELILAMYNCAIHIMLGIPKFNATYVADVSADAIPVTYTDSGPMIIVPAYFYLFLSVFGCIFTTELIHNCGWAVLCGYGFVRRHGLSLCKSSMERRFYWATVMVFFVYLVQFGPGRQLKEPFTVCTAGGVCVELRVPKGSQFLQQVVEDLTTTTAPGGPVVPPSIAPVLSSTPPNPPCQGSGSGPNVGGVIPLDAYRACPSGPSYPYTFYIPLLFDDNLQVIPPFQDSSFNDIPCTSTDTIGWGPYTHLDLRWNPHPKLCDGQNVDSSTTVARERDDCGNLKMKTIDIWGAFHDAYIYYKVLVLNSGEKYIACCYEYWGLGYLQAQHQALKCNIPRWNDDSIVKQRCDISSSSSSSNLVNRKTNMRFSKVILEDGYVLLPHHQNSILNVCLCKDFPIPDLSGTFSSSSLIAFSKCAELGQKLQKRDPVLVRCTTGSRPKAFYYPLMYNEFGHLVFPFPSSTFSCRVFGVVGVGPPQVISNSIYYLEGAPSYNTPPYNDLYDYVGRKITESYTTYPHPMAKDDCGSILLEIPYGVLQPEFRLVWLKTTVTGQPQNYLVCCADYKLQGTSPWRPTVSEIDQTQLTQWCNVPKKSKFASQCGDRFARANTHVEDTFLHQYPDFRGVTDAINKAWTPCICLRLNTWNSLDATQRQQIINTCNTLTLNANHVWWQTPNF